MHEAFKTFLNIFFKLFLKGACGLCPPKTTAGLVGLKSVEAYSHPPLNSQQNKEMICHVITFT